MSPWESELYGAARALGLVSAFSPRDGRLLLKCPRCPGGVPLDVVPTALSCPECFHLVEGEPWAMARTLAEQHKAAAPAEVEGDLPAIVWGKEIHSKVIVLPEELIMGVLHRGGKMVLGGGSKSFKTWCLADLAICIASGRPWWGRETRQGKVIYLNLEVQSQFFERRIKDICARKGMAVPEDIGSWSLRGHCTDHTVLLPMLAEKLKGMAIAAIILDPTYKVMTGSENAQEEVAALMNSIERLGIATGAAIIFGSHFAKGNAAGKEAIDRISGSGVFARDPDAILTMTKHEEEDVFIIETILRNCPPIEPFCVKWDFPLMHLNSEYDPAEIRQPAQPGRKKTSISTDDVVSVLRMEGGSVRGAHRSDGSLAKLLAAEKGCGLPSATAAVEAAVKAGRVRNEVKKEGILVVNYYKLNI